MPLAALNVRSAKLLASRAPRSPFRRWHVVAPNYWRRCTCAAPNYWRRCGRAWVGVDTLPQPTFSPSASVVGTRPYTRRSRLSQGHCPNVLPLLYVTRRSDLGGVQVTLSLYKQARSQLPSAKQHNFRSLSVGVAHAKVASSWAQPSATLPPACLFFLRSPPNQTSFDLVVSPSTEKKKRKKKKRLACRVFSSAGGGVMKNTRA